MSAETATVVMRTFGSIGLGMALLAIGIVSMTGAVALARELYKQWNDK
jgi:hypothetical protein